jgi:hypothetical protein
MAGLQNLFAGKYFYSNKQLQKIKSPIDDIEI